MITKTKKSSFSFLLTFFHHHSFINISIFFKYFFSSPPRNAADIYQKIYLKKYAKN